MKSATLPSFWEKYRAMSPAVRAGAKKAYRLWAENPFHPPLHFKCIDSNEDIWSVRVTKSHRANDDAMASKATPKVYRPAAQSHILHLIDQTAAL
jgi:hypothetical protein